MEIHNLVRSCIYSSLIILLEKFGRHSLERLLPKANPLWTLDNNLISQLVNRAGGKKGGIVSPKGPAGSVIFFHGCLVHASSNNLSPFNRISVYLSLCAISNHIRRFKRKAYIAHRDFSPIKCLPDDCLIKDYQVDLPWAKGVPTNAYQTSLEELSE